MKVGTKILLITLGAIACLVLAFFSVASVLLVDNFDRLENTNTVLTSKLARDLMDNELTILTSNTLSFANLDATYWYVAGQNPNYADSTFPESTFHDLGINAVFITNGTYDIILRLCYDDDRGIVKTPLSFLSDHLNKSSSELMVQGMKEGVSGIIMVDQVPYLVSAQPIHHGAALGMDNGNPVGVLILAKEIGQEMAIQLSGQLDNTNRTQVTLINYGQVIEGFGNSTNYGNSLMAHEEVRILGENHISGLSLFTDIYQHPALVMKLDAPRPLYQKALASETSLLVSLLILSVLLFITTVLLLQFFIISRINRLNDGVRRIKDRGGSGGRVEVHSNDELGSLALSINHMVGSLESSKKELLESERRYKAVIEDQTELVFRSTPRGTITFGNAAFLRYYGLTDNSIKGMEVPGNRTSVSAADPIQGFLPVPPSDVPLVHLKIAGLTPLEPVFEYEHELRASDLEARWFQWTVRGIFSEIGELAEVQWVGRDVTDRIRLLERLNKIDKIESLGVFAGGIAHDFNNYLTSIRGTLALMKMSISKLDARYGRLEEAERSVVKATELTKQLLTFSKGGEPVCKTVYLPEVLRETAEFGLRGSDITMSLSIADDLSCVDADEGQLFQVISNLIINAKQAMAAGGSIEIRAQDIALEEGSLIPLSAGKYVMIGISDRGTGIPKEVVGKIFDPFFTTKKNGTGLGLTIVHSIVAKHGGFIDVASEVGAGTTFTIYLPASTAKREAEPAFEEIPGTASGRVLIMDDEDSILEIGSELLRMNGYAVDCAVNGEEAVEMYKRAWEKNDPYRVVIIDLTIRGGMGGKEAIQKVLEINPEVKAIVSSGYSNDPVMANYRDYGFSGVVQKPYAINDMLDAVKRLVHLEAGTSMAGISRGGPDGIKEGGK
jgi:signal transduction histidine kinase/sensor domain CHASE-containing protein/CheY-like chemotaxis protein